MFSAIYVEEEIAAWPRVQAILASAPDVPVIPCNRYTEVFNRKAQNFRLQKQGPALIIARKHGHLVLPAPAGYGFNDMPSYYFSHMLNCVYDCRYCFLQGMYSSANYVLFVNYEDFSQALDETLDASGGAAVFYSGYDCDSLALEPISRFSEFYLPWFAQRPHALLEIRTKSTQIRSLLDSDPLPNVIVAMSFTSHAASSRWEHKVPTIEKRLEALAKLQRAGWKIALRFEPLVVNATLVTDYQHLFEQVFKVLQRDAIHSVSTGMFRMPVDFFKRIVRLYPDEALFAQQTIVTDGLVGIDAADEAQQLQALEHTLLQYVPAEVYYRCAS